MCYLLQGLPVGCDQDTNMQLYLNSLEKHNFLRHNVGERLLIQQKQTVSNYKPAQIMMHLPVIYKQLFHPYFALLATFIYFFYWSTEQLSSDGTNAFRKSFITSGSVHFTPLLTTDILESQGTSNLQMKKQQQLDGKKIDQCKCKLTTF